MTFRLRYVVPPYVWFDVWSWIFRNNRPCIKIIWLGSFPDGMGEQDTDRWPVRGHDHPLPSDTVPAIGIKERASYGNLSTSGTSGLLRGAPPSGQTVGHCGECFRWTSRPTSNLHPVLGKGCAAPFTAAEILYWTPCGGRWNIGASSRRTGGRNNRRTVEMVWDGNVPTEDVVQFVSKIPLHKIRNHPPRTLIYNV